MDGDVSVMKTEPTEKAYVFCPLCAVCEQATPLVALLA